MMRMDIGRTPGGQHTPAEELARRQGIGPVESVDELACPGLFASDGELEEFLLFTYAARRAPEHIQRECWPEIEE